MFIRVQMAEFALGMAHDLQRAVGDHLIGVHVGRGAGAALNEVDDELVMQLARADLVAGGGNRLAARGVEQAQIAVGAGGGLFDRGQRIDQFRRIGNGAAGDGEVLHRAQRMHPPIGRSGHFAVAQKVMFDAVFDGHDGLPPGHARNARFLVPAGDACHKPCSRNAPDPGKGPMPRRTRLFRFCITLPGGLPHGIHERTRAAGATVKPDFHREFRAHHLERAAGQLCLDQTAR